MLIIKGEHVSSSPCKGHLYWAIGLFICLVVALWATAEEACSRCYDTLQKACWAAEFQLGAPSSLQTVRKSPSIMNSFHLVGCDYRSWRCSGSDSRYRSQLCQMVSLRAFRADETRQERHLGRSQERKWERERLHLFLFFLIISILKDHDWIICNK